MTNLKILIHAALIHALILTSVSVPVASARTPLCSGVFARITSADFNLLATFQGKLGGSESAWKNFLKDIESRKTPEEIATLRRIAETSSPQSWRRRVLLNRFAFQIYQVFAVLEKTNSRTMDLANKSYWYELTLAERRGLLLAEYNKWWWEADSPQVLGMSKWFNTSFLISEILLEPLETTLDLRVHQLIANDATAGFFSTLFKHFSTEIKIFKSIENSKERNAVFTDLLIGRIKFFYALKSRYSGILRPHQIEQMDQQIYRAEVLIRMLEKNRPLSKEEALETTEEIVMDESVFYNFKNRTLANISIHKLASFAAYLGLAYLISAIMDEEKATDPMSVPLNDLMGLPTDN